jgi:hypothetical protein
VKDASGQGNDGTLSGGEFAPGRDGGQALRLDGQGSVSVVGRPDCSGKPLTVGAWTKPEAADGVLLAQGGASHGFVIYLKDARPHFAVRSGGTLAMVAGSEKLQLGQWAHLAGVLNARGELHLRVDGKDVATAKSGAIVSRPADKLEIGNDSGSHVAEYGAATAWRGLIDDVRLYWGELEPERIESWAGK